MVLSNKKLKQKLREAKTEKLTASEVQINSTNTKDVKAPQNPSAKTQESIQSLLNTVTQKPRISKREKRRENLQSLPEKIKTLNVSNGGEVKKEGDETALNKKEKKKKRKREEGDEVKGEDNVEGKEAKKAKNVKKKSKKKKKRKVKKKMEDKEIVVNASEAKEEQILVETTKASESIENLYEFTKVYVGGIPYYSTEDDIKSYFESCGTITELDCMFFPESGKFRGIAIISFKTEAAAKRALALDGSDMGGLYLKIQPYKSTRLNKTSPFIPAIVEGYNKIYVGNLSWDITEDDLRTLFSGCNINSIRFGEDKETKEFKGYGHVEFADSESVNVALKFDQHIVCGRPIRISRAVPKKSGITNTPTIQENDQVNTNDDIIVTHVQQSEPVEVGPVEVVTSNEVAVVSSKIRRRTCYECGERGHLSSACPKKQESDQVTFVAP